MARVIVMPKMGEAMEEGQVTSWLCKEGDKVEKNQPLFELETDKTTMEFPCPEDGTVLKIMAECGEDIACGTPIAVIGAPGEDISGLI
ncbi:biotin/lipoyl-containing protein [Oscillibacter sp.]|uniref:biotin/lipoyl-containing protein n=1 Tax=Oscillibacter sp. TaxID=1945593 RepID=UPI002D7EE3B6|nr:biotin/lipoyl-containing protein [Oscillibacter sp.]